MPGKRGRPMKYRLFIECLDDATAYCPSSIVANGERLGLFSQHKKKKERKLAKLRVRITLGRFSSNHDFPIGGDDLVFLPGQAPIPGWYGARWKAAIED